MLPFLRKRPNYFLSMSLCLGAFALPTVANDETDADVAELSTINVSGQQNLGPKITTEKLLKVPGAGGDPLKAIEALPGVVLGGFGPFTMPAVRGSSPEDNLFVTDFLPVGYVFHNDSGSTYNENLVRDFKLLTGAWTPEHYNAMGSVMTTQLRDPYAEDLTTTLDLSFLRLGGLVEGAISDDSAFYFSYRQSLLEFYVENFIDEDELSFTEVPKNSDYQFKYHWRVDNVSNLKIVATGAKDSVGIEFGEESDLLAHEPGLEEGFDAETYYHNQGVIYDTVLSGGTASILAIGHKEEQTTLDIGVLYDLDAVNYEYRLKNFYNTPLTNGDNFRYGFDIAQTDIEYASSGKVEPCNQELQNCTPFSLGEAFISNDRFTINSQYVFAKYDWLASPFLQVSIGLGASQNDYLEGATPEPRLESRYEVTPGFTLTAAAGRHHQFPRPREFQFIAPEFGNPDLDMPYSDHYVVGFEYAYENSISTKVEAYYKDINNLFVSNKSYISKTDTPNEVTYLNGATGEAYGLEMLINKNLTDKWYGWLSVAYSETTRKDETRDKEFNYELDRPWIVNLVASYKKSKTTSYGLKWRYQSGNLFTPVTSAKPVDVNGNDVAVDGNGEPTSPDDVYLWLPTYAEKNSERLPASHRLDFRIDYEPKPDATYYFEIINVYNQLNVTEYKYDEEYKTREKVESLPTIFSIGMKLVY